MARTSDAVLSERRGRALVITINRPGARNAVNRAVSVGLADAVRRLDAASVDIADIALRRPTLDDVFFSLTGHAAEEPEEGAEEVAA